MKSTFFSALLIAMLYIPATAGDYMVMFETTGCSGETGFASAKVEAIYKVEDAGCLGKDGKKLKKILVKNDKGSYDAFTLTQAEAKNVISEMKAYMNARLKNLENANTLIITK